MKPALIDLLRTLLFPPRCAGCGRPVASGTLCEICAASVHVHRTLFCGSCDTRLFGDKNICHPDFPYLLGAAVPYAGAVAALVRAMKFGRSKNAAGPLVGFMKEYVASLGVAWDGALVMPIPLSKKRFRERGFNQAELLARALAGHLGLKIDLEAFIRHRHTRPQTEMKSAEERSTNLHGCFSVTDPALVRGRTIVLVDDVTTTGATLLEAARTLRAAGSGTIYAITAAKA